MSLTLRIPDMDDPQARELARTLQKVLETHPGTAGEAVVALAIVLGRLIAEWAPVERPATMSYCMMMVAEFLIRAP